jgi:hypothetical protein
MRQTRQLRYRESRQSELCDLLSHWRNQVNRLDYAIKHISVPPKLPDRADVTQHLTRDCAQSFKGRLEREAMLVRDGKSSVRWSSFLRKYTTGGFLSTRLGQVLHARKLCEIGFGQSLHFHQSPFVSSLIQKQLWPTPSLHM